MNNHAEIASQRGDVKPSPFPPEQLRRVFVPNVCRDGYLEQAWSKWGGETDFVYNVLHAGECALCIFTKGALGPNNELARLVKPFFDRHGLEANVFEYDVQANVFRRINPEWLATYYPDTRNPQQCEICNKEDGQSCCGYCNP